MNESYLSNERLLLNQRPLKKLVVVENMNMARALRAVDLVAYGKVIGLFC